jgi:hypothetical protein
MSGGKACKCPESKKTLMRSRNWVVYQRNCNHSAFNGYRYTPSDWSCVGCRSCGAVWRTKASYIGFLLDKHQLRDPS